MAGLVVMLIFCLYAVNINILKGEEFVTENSAEMGTEIVNIEIFNEDVTEKPEETDETLVPEEVHETDIHSQFSSEVNQEETEMKIADFDLYVREDIPLVKAGQQAGYEIVLKNTGTEALENLEIRYLLDDGNLLGTWLETDGLSVDVSTGTAVLSLLEAGMEKKIVLMVRIPEECHENLEAEFIVNVLHPQQSEIISRSAGIVTEVVPLIIDFTVKKWADRARAIPGDTITYQICIRNTGERSLHSVLTTEKFQTAGLKAQFQEQEGVILNGAKTEALIAEIKPGEAYGLYATVMLPEDFEGGDLLNEVTVVTRETGETQFNAQAKVELEKLQPTELPPIQEKAEPVYEEKNVQIKEIPQTGDLSESELWAGAFGISSLVVIGIYWFRKAKRKR